MNDLAESNEFNNLSSEEYIQNKEENTEINLPKKSNDIKSLESLENKNNIGHKDTNKNLQDFQNIVNNNNITNNENNKVNEESKENITNKDSVKDLNNTKNKNDDSKHEQLKNNRNKEILLINKDKIDEYNIKKNSDNKENNETNNNIINVIANIQDKKIISNIANPKNKIEYDKEEDNTIKDNHKNNIIDNDNIIINENNNNIITYNIKKDNHENNEILTETKNKDILNIIKKQQQKFKEEKIDESSDSNDSDNDDYSFNVKSNRVCGIKNLGNNCYLNSGLQIFASCEALIDLLQQEDNKKLGAMTCLFKKAMNKLLNGDIYNPEDFIDYFCKLNHDFIKGAQCCSQSFIRTLITNINQEYINKNYNIILENDQYPKKKDNEYTKYKEFVANIYPESKAQSIFSGISKCHSEGKCQNCKKLIDNYSFNFFIDQIMYLDDFENECEFNDILKGNLGNYCNLTMDCPGCEKEIIIEEKTKIIKLPEILIFTLERYQGNPNHVAIKPNIEIDMKDYIDESLIVDSTLYELFAINIRFGETIDFGHEICQVKRGEKWFRIDDNNGYEIEPLSFDESSSYGLFYRRKKLLNENKDFINGKLPKIINKKKEKWFIPYYWDMIRDKLCSFFWKNEDYNDIIQIKQAIYIISESQIPIYQLSSTYNEQKLNLTNLLKSVILEIKKNNIYDVQNFIEQILKNENNYKDIKDISVIDFINILLNLINKEYTRANFFIYNKNMINYKTENDKEKLEFDKLINQTYPQSMPLFLYSGINKIYIKGKCECKNKINEYKFENFKNKEIFIKDIKTICNFSKILFDNFKKEINTIICNNCKTKNMKIIIENKLIKLGDVIVFSIKNNNNVKFIPDEKLDLKNLLDESIIDIQNNYEYELFAITCKSITSNNISIPKCKIKINGKFYEIIDENNVQIYDSQNEIFCDLFYRKLK